MFHLILRFLTGVKGGEKLGVEPILKAKDMADKNVEHLGIMAYAANFQWIPGRIAPSQRIKVTCDKHASRVNENVRKQNIKFPGATVLSIC